MIVFDCCFFQDDAECDDQEPSDSSTSGISSNICTANLSLPPCNLQHLTEIELILSQNMLLTTQRERMATVLQQNGYIILFTWWDDVLRFFEFFSCLTLQSFLATSMLFAYAR